MPGQDGKLTEEEKEKINDWFTSRAKEHICPVCKGTDWFLAEHLVQPITLSGTDLILGGGPGYPQIMLISKTCGHTQFFNAVVLGIVSPADVAKAKEGG